MKLEINPPPKNRPFLLMLQATVQGLAAAQAPSCVNIAPEMPLLNNSDGALTNVIGISFERANRAEAAALHAAVKQVGELMGVAIQQGKTDKVWLLQAESPRAMYDALRHLSENLPLNDVNIPMLNEQMLEFAQQGNTLAVRTEAEKPEIKLKITAAKPPLESGSNTESAGSPIKITRKTPQRGK